MAKLRKKARYSLLLWLENDAQKPSCLPWTFWLKTIQALLHGREPRDYVSQRIKLLLLFYQHESSFCKTYFSCSKTLQSSLDDSLLSPSSEYEGT